MTQLHARDLRVFGDLGTDFREDVSSDGHQVFFLTLDALKTSIEVMSDGLIRLSRDGVEENFANAKSLLSSPAFGDLRRWAGNQAAVLSHLPSMDFIEVEGELETKTLAQRMSFLQFNTFLAANSGGNLQVVLIDGPAGIGKTTQLNRIAYDRAEGFSSARNRLLLQVESTGRVLQNLSDLISGSLNKIRAKVTDDQLLVLVRHGLVTLVIDGFDEMTDPSGYQQAWAQLSALLSEVSGEGQVLLAGRETIVSVDRLKSALPILSSEHADVSEFKLRTVSPQVAKSWLVRNGVLENSISDLLNDMLSPGSYALRPFFLSKLTDPAVLSAMQAEEAVDLLSILTNALIEREKGKFGSDFEKLVSRDALGKYVRDVCEEIARDMADNQSESLPADNIKWISEMCLPDGLDDSTRMALINRSEQLPFLTPDSQRNSATFWHRQFFVHFLGANATRSLALGEVPKYLRRVIPPESRGLHK